MPYYYMSKPCMNRIGHGGKFARTNRIHLLLPLHSSIGQGGQNLRIEIRGHGRSDAQARRTATKGRLGRSVPSAAIVPSSVPSETTTATGSSVPWLPLINKF